MTEKIYSPNQAFFGALIGGPLASAYYLSLALEANGKKQSVYLGFFVSVFISLTTIMLVLFPSLHFTMFHVMWKGLTGGDVLSKWLVQSLCTSFIFLNLIVSITTKILLENISIFKIDIADKRIAYKADAFVIVNGLLFLFLTFFLAGAGVFMISLIMALAGMASFEFILKPFLNGVNS